MAEYRIISSDNHIVEPPDPWTDRTAPESRDRDPVAKDTERGPFCVVDDMMTFNIFAMGAQPGTRFDEPEELHQAEPFENVRPGAYIGEEAVKDMDIDGVDVGLTYRSLTIVPDPFVQEG